MQLCLGEMLGFFERQLLVSQPYQVINQVIIKIKSHIANLMFQQVFLFILTFYLQIN